MSILGGNSREAQQNGNKTVLFVLLPCILLCLGVALVVVLDDTSPLNGWVRTTDDKVQSYNEWLNETWKTGESESWSIGDAPILLYEYKKDNYPIFVIGTYEVFKNSLQPGLNQVPPIWGMTVLPEGGLPLTDGKEEAGDYVERVKAYIGSLDLVREANVYKDKEHRETEKVTYVAEMPIAQVEDLGNGISAARFVFQTREIHEDGAEEVSFQDAIIVFDEEDYIYIGIGGFDYDKHRAEEEQIVDYIKKNYPNIEFGD